jgi:hypothetical protein
MKRSFFLTGSRLVLTFVLTLTSSLVFRSLAQPPAWALGEEPSFSGMIENWSLADALAPTEGTLYAVYSFQDGREDVEIASGHVNADGSFTFALQKNASAASGGEVIAWSNCYPDTLVSSPEQKLAVVDLVAEALYEEGSHARPRGNVFISAQNFNASGEHVKYQFVYADRDGTVKERCDISEENYSFHIDIDLDLRKGWNSVQADVGADKVIFKTAALPEDIKWFLVSPLTINGQ